MINPEEIGFPEKAWNVGTSLDIKDNILDDCCICFGLLDSTAKKHGTFTEDNYHACAFIIVVTTQNIALLY